ncbi:hypothetical protein TWF506_010443 [Arthrobotrys conoides]|uniref:Uncharacterized protein n=1 Tax=Arthrobotrys conoides TaxID=74498 RepID=A0AAN8RSA5_9PEZI
MPARDLATDLAKEVFRRVPGELANSKNVEFLAEEYLLKEPSLGLDPEISRDARLEKIFDRYIRDLELYLPRYLDELLDEEFQRITVASEDGEKEGNEDFDVGICSVPEELETGSEFNPQPIQHISNNSWDISNPNTSGDFLTPSNNNGSQSGQTTFELTKETSEAMPIPSSPETFSESSDSKLNDSDSIFSSRPSSAETSTTSLFDPFDSSPNALPKAVEVLPNQKVEYDSVGQTTWPIEPSSTDISSSDPEQMFSEEQPEVIFSPALPTPEMVFDKPGLGSPLSDSSTELEDDDINISQSSKTQFSGIQTPMPMGKATGLGLLTQDSTEFRTQQDPVYIVESDQDPLFTPPYYQNPQLSLPQFLDNIPVVAPLGGTRAPPIQHSLNDKPVATSVSEQVVTVEQVGFEDRIPTDILAINSDELNLENKGSEPGLDEQDPVNESEGKEKASLSSKESPTTASPLDSPDLEPSNLETSSPEQIKTPATKTVPEKVLPPIQVQTEVLKPTLPTAPVPGLQIFTASDPESETPLAAAVSPSSDLPVNLGADDNRTPNTKGLPSGFLSKISFGRILPEWGLKTPLLPNILPQIPSVSLPWIVPVSLASSFNPTPKVISGTQTVESYHDSLFVPPPIPGGFPHTEDFSEEPVAELCEVATSDPNTQLETSSTENSSSNIWDEIISLLNTILLQAWVPYFELIRYLAFSSKALDDSYTEFPVINSFILDSWTPGLELLHCIISLPQLLPEHIVPESDYFIQPSIELWTPVLEAVEHLSAALSQIPYHRLFYLSTYQSLAAFILGLSSTIGNLRSSTLPSKLVAQLTEILPSFPITSWLKLYDEALFQDTTTKDSPKEIDAPISIPSSTPPSCPHESFSVCTCQVLKSFSPQTNSEFNFYTGFRFNPQLLQRAGCSNIPCSYSHLYLYLILLTWVTEPAYFAGSTRSFGSIVSCSLSIFLPILLHFKFSLGFPLSVLHLSYSSLRLLRNVLV